MKSREKYLHTMPNFNLKKLNFVFSITGYIDSSVVEPSELLRTISVTFQEGERYLDEKNKIRETFREWDTRPCVQNDFVIQKVDLLSSKYL